MVKNGENKNNVLSTLDNLGYLGQYDSKFVSGFRVVIPKVYRGLLGEEFIITKGYEGALIVVDFKRWEKLIKPLKNTSFLSRSLRETLRFLIASAFVVKIDSQGRFVIPAKLREYSGLTREKIGSLVAIVGVFNWIEIWEYDRWIKHEGNLDVNADEIAEELNALKEISS